MSDFIISILVIVFMISPFILFGLFIYWVIKRHTKAKTKKPINVQNHFSNYKANNSNIIKPNLDFKTDNPKTVTIKEIDVNNQDPLLKEALELVVKNKNSSVFFLMRELKIGMNRANSILEQLESNGIVGKFNGAKQRNIIIENITEVKCKNESINVSNNDLTNDEISDFAKIEIEKRLSKINPKSTSFSLDEDLMDDVISHILEKGTTNYIQSHFNLNYTQRHSILKDLCILKIASESENEYYPKLLIRDIYDFELYKSKRSVFKEKYLPELENQINDIVDQRYSEIKIQNEKWDLAELKRKEDEIRNKIIKQQQDKDLQRKIRQQMIDEGVIENLHSKRREKIPQEIQDAVWNRDGGKCVLCGSSEKLEFDHIIPFSKGGANTYRNLQLLCEKCNREKSNKIG